MGKPTPIPWTAMLKPPASFVDHGWRAMAVCGDWIVAVRANVAMTIENGRVLKSWDNEANAEFIARVVNSYEALLAALRGLEDAYCEVSPDMSKATRDRGRKALIAARAAIAAASDPTQEDV